MTVTSETIHELCLRCGTEAAKGNRRILSIRSTSLVASSVKNVLIQRLECTYSGIRTSVHANLPNLNLSYYFCIATFTMENDDF